MKSEYLPQMNRHEAPETHEITEDEQNFEILESEATGLLNDLREVENLQLELLSREFFEREHGRLTKYERKGLTEGRIGITATPEEARRSWRGGFTDPFNHNPQEFRYLVHGIQGTAARAIQMIALLRSAQEGTGHFDSSQHIDLLKTPKRISEKKVISCSVIDQEKTSTFGSVGLILRTPSENVIEISSQDQGTNFMNPDDALKTAKQRQGQLCTVDELVKHTDPYLYNEVVLSGRSEHGEVEVAGFWIKVYPDGDPVDPEVAIKVRLLAFSERKPLVVLIEKGADYKDGKPEVLGKIISSDEADGVAINRNGMRYVFDFRENKFFKLDAKYRARELTPEEVIWARSVIVQELDEKTKSQNSRLIEALNRMG